MLGGYLEFFMKPALADTYISLRREVEELIQKKVRIDHFAKLKTQMHLNSSEMIIPVLMSFCTLIS